MFRYLKASFNRKKARRVTREYPPRIDRFQIDGIGEVAFANWTNPLTPEIRLHNGMVEFFKKFIKPGDLAIDIGANVGDTTVPMALCTGLEGLTLGFDPNPYVFKILQKNAGLNPDKVRLVPVPYAISSRDGEEYYFVSSEASFGNGAISPTKESRHGKFVYSGKVRGVNLHAFLKREYPEWLNKFTFIKIDTEGYDKEILKSIGSLIDACKPVIIAESFGKATDAEKMELYDVIARHGYSVFYFADFDVEANVIPVLHRDDMLRWKQTINIYAIPR
ncbi:MAG: FkbM family methyltransferase [Chitinophagaceae bacterium]|nr:FkbM family methyltransferase [Chitinophagaceae bacterium]